MIQTQTNQSEVAQLLASIDAEYLAAKLGLLGLRSGTSQHRMITARMERIGEYQEQLHQLVGEKAIPMIAETLAKLPETPTRRDIERVLRRELGATEDTDILLDWLREAWDTADFLIQRFGGQAACTMLTAPECRNGAPKEETNSAEDGKEGAMRVSGSFCTQQSLQPVPARQPRRREGGEA